MDKKLINSEPRSDLAETNQNFNKNTLTPKKSNP